MIKQVITVLVSISMSGIKNHSVMLVFTFLVLSWPPISNADDKKTYGQVAKIVEHYCSGCHYTPSPSLMPKKSWPYVVKRMAEIAEDKYGKPFISEAHIRDITAFYYGNSPDALPVLPYVVSEKKGVMHRVSEIGRKAKLPLVINLKAVELTGAAGQEFLVCDGETDTVSHLVIDGSKWTETILAKVKVPSNATVVDIDNDGDNDVLVSSLGLFFPPTGVYAGRVVLLEQVKKNKFEKKVILEDVGRVTDAQPLDMDDDGDLDIAVSIFGGDVPGEIAWLENLGVGKGYKKRTLFNIGGGLNITPVDINNDGKLDLVSFLTQEHEQIVALINRGGGNYEQALLFQASHPMVGPTAINFYDIDMDGDTDILFTNGDAHDFQHDPKPYHGVQWLENGGGLEFEYRDVGRFYGASKAQVGDWDSDGDNDIVASSWNNYWEDEKRQTLIWYENDGKQNFHARPIIHEPSSIVSFELVDIDGNGDLDILAGLFDIDLLKKFMNLQFNDRARAKDILKNENTKPRIVKISREKPVMQLQDSATK